MKKCRRIKGSRIYVDRGIKWPRTNKAFFGLERGW